MVQIFEAMADITISRLEKIKKAETAFDDKDIEMVSAVLNLYRVISETPQPDLFQ